MTPEEVQLATRLPSGASMPAIGTLPIGVPAGSLLPACGTAYSTNLSNLLRSSLCSLIATLAMACTLKTSSLTEITLASALRAVLRSLQSGDLRSTSEDPSRGHARERLAAQTILRIYAVQIFEVGNRPPRARVHRPLAPSCLH
jgi:hypothetical protein